jgi:hypothetical protein
MKVGDSVRVLKVPSNLLDDPEFRTLSVFEKCVGRLFPVVGIREDGMIEIEIGEVLGKPSNMETIWIEPDCIAVMDSP